MINKNQIHFNCDGENQIISHFIFAKKYLKLIFRRLNPSSDSSVNLSFSNKILLNRISEVSTLNWNIINWRWNTRLRVFVQLFSNSNLAQKGQETAGLAKNILIRTKIILKTSLLRPGAAATITFLSYTATSQGVPEVHHSHYFQFSKFVNLRLLLNSTTSRWAGHAAQIGATD